MRQVTARYGYLLKETESGSLLTFEILEEWIVESLKLKIVEEALNEELSQNDEPAPDANCLDSHLYA